MLVNIFPMLNIHLCSQILLRIQPWPGKVIQEWGYPHVLEALCLVSFRRSLKCRYHGVILIIQWYVIYIGGVSFIYVTYGDNASFIIVSIKTLV